MLGALAWQVAYLNKKSYFCFGERSHGVAWDLSSGVRLFVCVLVFVYLYWIPSSVQILDTVQIVATSTTITQHTLSKLNIFLVIA
ncbi:hypothetical protein HanPI659440_Chr11g0405561 [Helianthus annuus]|nr:hypothetical protein HanPI659440_Chr11g0405561 [Helianthus annuus]